MLIFWWVSEPTVPLIYHDNNICGLSRVIKFSLQTALYSKCQFWWIACQAMIQTKSWNKSIITWCSSLRKPFVLSWALLLFVTSATQKYWSFLYYLSKLFFNYNWKGYILQKKLIHSFLLKLFQFFFFISKNRIIRAVSQCYWQFSW